ncbi:MAG: response regulator [Microthrixaceae bacterium]
MRVLICDDEADIRLLYRMAFEELGADVVEAVDGDDCLGQMADACPDLVILDLFMPKRDGLSALPELKQRCPGARVLVVSAHAAEQTFTLSRARGATACFEKLSFVTRIPRLVERYGGAA